MAIPDYQSLTLPLLRFSADGSTHNFSDAIDHLADEFISLMHCGISIFLD
jgi:restriction system protein